jgi:hypothetical protein
MRRRPETSTVWYALAISRKHASAENPQVLTK